VAGAKAVASANRIGSGGSAGREGPSFRLVPPLGSTIGQYLRLSEDRIKVLVGCGPRCWKYPRYSTPHSRVMFSVEVILGDFTIATFCRFSYIGGRVGF
jgi:CIC family chloride channel protein